ncbi:PREDICTED: protein FEZ isoform X2 [Nelumbo nucifera]|uniref:Protein FEZ isoform X2 n=1 Tax=Nelumbo nucifera TaxID=4432 RepID=A0A1U7ZUM6_NELNU|nr:PREDICTED: protein FEZ isoform X2 [Nelumbo nucifera]
MDEKNDMEKVDEVMLPGFRFHPTDEELVGFYLRRKIHQRPLSIELIKQLDIYKYDPWDLPKLATTGEKEWYFYCPRDRKYRNSARPNRVTGAGFWKATGTDRPIYSSEGTKCIGLKKSLVFYKGRAAKGIKTDWMMHEFRLPSLSDSASSKRPMDKDLPANDSWAICRIFKKANSMAQRALSHSWVSPLPEPTGSDILSSQGAHCTQFSPENISCTTEAGSGLQFGCNNDLQQCSTTCSFPTLDAPSYRSSNHPFCKTSLPPISNGQLPAGFMFSPVELAGAGKSTVDVASMLLNLSPAIMGDAAGKVSEHIDFGGAQQQCEGFSITLPQEEMQGNMGAVGVEETCLLRKNSSSNISQVNNNNSNNQWGTVRSVGFPFSLPSNMSEAWKLNFPYWDSPPCPSEMSTASYSINKCYT